MFTTGITATPGVTYSAGVTFHGGLQSVLDSNEVIGRWLATTALAPPRCLYMRGKPLSVSPGVIESVQSMWRTAVSGSTAVFCVGVNPNAEDRHIWDPIAITPANLHFIGGKAGFDEWIAQHRGGRGD